MEHREDIPTLHISTDYENMPDTEPDSPDGEWYTAEEDGTQQGARRPPVVHRAVEVHLALDENADPDDEPTVDNIRLVQRDGRPAPVQLTREQLLQLINHIRYGNLVIPNDQHHGLEESDDDMEAFLRGHRRRRRPAYTRPVYPPVPHPEGRKLMRSGLFGTNPGYRDVLKGKKRPLARGLLARELATDRSEAIKTNQLIAQEMIPSSEADTIIHYDQRCYSGQFSDDGNFFFSCSQDFLVRMYDTSNPYDWRHYKSVEFLYPQWTITDASLSPDNKFLAYTSIRDLACLATTDPNDTREPQVLNFSMSGHTTRPRAWGGRFGIWSIRFSGDGRELVAGTGDNSVYVYDLQRNESILRIPGHTDDVNAVCYGDKNSPHILYSGSDDSLLKVWDRRSLRDNREAGVFVGHTEGLTYVDSKGDGRYVLSNGKDQTMKLWDLRKMMSTEQAAGIQPERYSTGFDYRYMTFSEQDYNPHPHDCSVVTFRGHSVLRTLIRCHFSPPGSTDSRYVYTGSQDGKVYIYNLDATVASIIDVEKATHNSRPQNPRGVTSMWDMDEDGQSNWKACVRDAAWHPFVPMIAATSWNGWGGSSGTCTIHSWHEGPAEDESGIEKGRRVDSQMRDDPSLYHSSDQPWGWGVRSRLRRRL